ncbi:hypothetical protein KR038_008734, partial [Drosophila bunnanda]
LKVDSKFEFTNLKCTSFNESALKIEKCFLKSINRTYKYASFQSKFQPLPVTNVTVGNILHFAKILMLLYILSQIHVQVFKRLNGYKPFLFNFTVDACLFLKGKRNKVTQFFYDLVAPYSNISHPCPYNAKLPITYVNHILDTVLPVPDGFYLIQSVYYTHGVKLLELKSYMNIY